MTYQGNANWGFASLKYQQLDIDFTLEDETLTFWHR
jgi:hypothetical protein